MQSPAAIEDTARKTIGEPTAHSRRVAYSILAWSLCAVSLALLIGTIILIWLATVALADGGPLQPAYSYVTSGTNVLAFDIVGYALQLAPMIAFALIGALIAARVPAQPIGWIMCGMSLFGLCEEFATYYALYGLLLRPGALPYGLAAAWFTEWSWTAFFGLLNVGLPLLFPTGRLPSPRWWPAGWFAAGACLFLTLGFMAKPGPLGNRTRLAAIESPVKLFAPGGLIQPFADLAFVCVLVSMLLAAISLIVRWRQARGDARAQLKWFCYPITLLIALFMFQGVCQYGLGIWSPALGIGHKVAWAIAFTALPIAIGVAILKYRLYDIDLVINRTLVYGALSVSVAGVYVLVVGALGALFQARGDLAISLIATALVALLFQPCASGSSAPSIA